MCIAIIRAILWSLLTIHQLSIVTIVRSILLRPVVTTPRQAEITIPQNRMVRIFHLAEIILFPDRILHQAEVTLLLQEVIPHPAVATQAQADINIFMVYRFEDLKKRKEEYKNWLNQVREDLNGKREDTSVKEIFPGSENGDVATVKDIVGALLSLLTESDVTIN